MSLQRQLSSRHLSMIAMGGSIGTGLFLASGSTLHSAGLMSGIVAFLIIGAMVYFLMTGLAEMVAYQPTSGSFCEYASDYVSRPFGFAMSINYWFNWAITLAAEISAASIIIQFWFPHLSPLWMSIAMMSMLLFLNIISVKNFGESEYWLSMIKVVMVVVFLATGGLMLLGVFGNHENYAVSSIQQSHLFTGKGWLGVFDVMLVAGFAFQGSELIGVAAGESKNPRVDIPKATGLIFWRILLFYILTIIVIGALIPSTDPHLIGASEKEIAFSPFTMIMQQAHVPGAAALMNFVILSAVFSSANSGVYASSRTLYQLAVKNNWKLFSTVTEQGVPVYALLATLTVGGLTLLSSCCGNGMLYAWLIAASALSGFIAWAGIAITHLYFRRAFIKNGKLMKELPYVSKFHPYSTLIALVLCLLVIAGQNYSMILSGHIDFSRTLLTYSSIILFGLIWAGCALKIYLKEKFSNKYSFSKIMAI